MIAMVFTAWVLPATPARAADRCSLELERPPKLAVAKEFRPAPQTCKDPLLPRCRASSVFRDAEPAFADYTLTCTERVEKPPAPKTPKKDATLLDAVRTGPWLDGVAVIVPGDSRCAQPAGVPSRLGRRFPNLLTLRKTPPEREARLRVWTLTLDEEGYASVTGPDYTKPVRGPEPGKLPEAVCRRSFDFDGKRRNPNTRTIVATCRGTPRPPIQAACGKTDVIWSDLRRLISGSGNDPGTSHLKVLVATDEEVRDLTAAQAKPEPPPAPKPTIRSCDEPVRPVPLEQLQARWSGNEQAISAAVEAGGSTGCFVVAQDLDPEGRVLSLTTRTIDDEADRAILSELWASDAGLGSSLLAALKPEGGRTPTLAALDLRRLATTALEDRRALELTKRTVEAYEASRQRLTTALDQGRDAISSVEAQNIETRAELLTLLAEWSEAWPSLEDARLDDLAQVRQLVATELRNEALRPNDRRAGNGVVLEMINLMGRVEADPLYQLFQETDAIEADLEVTAPDLLGECQTWLSETEAEMSAPMSLEEALERPEAFRQRRDVVAELERRLDDGPCRRSADLAEALVQRVRNARVSGDVVSPRRDDHPRLTEADRLVKRGRAWLRGIEHGPPNRFSLGFDVARRTTDGAATRLGLTLGFHDTLVQRRAVILGWRILPTVRWRLGETEASRVEIVAPLDLFVGLGPAWRSHTVVQPQIHVGGELRIPAPGQTRPVRGAARVGGGLWLQPSRTSGHGAYVDFTAALRPTGGQVRTSASLGVGWVYQWSRR